VLACSLTEATRGLAGKRFFAAAKPGAIIVNIGRGGLVDDSALIAALDAGRLDRAILDVFHTEPLPADDPLWSHPKVHLTPHTSFAGDGVQGRWDDLFLDNIARYVRGEPLARLVDPADI
jgi:phosphoglycerate dehydrogenase-like enzyme